MTQLLAASANRNSQIIADIYSAGSGRTSWAIALDALCRELHLWSAQIVAIDKKSGAVSYSFEGGDASAQLSLAYMCTYHRLNPHLPYCIDLDSRQWFHSHHVFDEHYVANSVFYQDFLIPNGGRYCSVCKLIEDDQQFIFFVCITGTGREPVNALEIARLEQLREPFARGLAIFQDEQKKLLKTAVAHQLLNKKAQAVLLVDQHCRIHYCSDFADQILNDTRFFKAADGTFRCVDPESHERFVGALMRLLAPPIGAAGSNDCGVIRLTASNRPAVILMMERLLPESYAQRNNAPPMAFVLLHQLGTARAVNPVVVAEALGLTPAEAEVSTSLANGYSPEQIALSRGVSTATVRAQLRAVHAKSGVSRQSELVRLIRDMPDLDMSELSRLIPVSHQETGGEYFR